MEKSRPGRGEEFSGPFLESKSKFTGYDHFWNLHPNLGEITATIYRVRVQTFKLQEQISHPHIPGRQIHEWQKRKNQT